MRIKVLGSAAGGGFPQWNCVCHNCSGLRAGTLRGKPRTQTQIAFSAQTNVWFLIGASPDLRSQIAATPELSPSADEPGFTPIAGVFLTSADVDSVMGLLHLREFQNFCIFAAPAVQRILKDENHIFRVLNRANPPVQWQPLAIDRRVSCHLSQNASDVAAFFYTAVPLGGDYPDYASEDLRNSSAPGNACVGFLLEHEGKKLFIAPTISGRDAEWSKWAKSASVALLDGTFWSDEELIAAGRTTRTARQMGHLPLSGTGGLLTQFPKDVECRKILIHINNTNPILDEESAEHRAVLEAGFEIAYDGLTIEL